MSLDNINNNPIINTLRSGTGSDAYYLYVDVPLKIINNKVLLTEIPDKVYKVRLVDTSQPTDGYY